MEQIEEKSGEKTEEKFLAFVEEARRRIERKIGKEGTVEKNVVRKNNGVNLTGLTIRERGCNVCPTIYMNSLYENFLEGESMDAITECVWNIYLKRRMEQNVNMGFWDDFQKAKDRIVYKLVNRRKNEELLTKIPYVAFLDLAVCFYYLLDHEALGRGSILIYRSQMEKWNVSLEELSRIASKNTRELLPAEMLSLSDLIKDAEMEGEEETILREFRIWSNNRRTQGAAVMLYPEILKETAKEWGDFYILPSSVHEIIFLKKTDCREAEYLKKMVKEVNDTQVEPEEILSYEVYWYNSKEEKLGIA